MSADQINAWANLIKEFTLGAASIIAAFYSWRVARRSARVERKVDTNEKLEAERHLDLAEAVQSVASSVRGGEPGVGAVTTSDTSVVPPCPRGAGGGDNAG